MQDISKKGIFKVLISIILSRMLFTFKNIAFKFILKILVKLTLYLILKYL